MDGIGECYNINPVIIRIGFMLLAFCNGIGILLYLLLAIIIPKDD